MFPDVKRSIATEGVLYPGVDQMSDQDCEARTNDDLHGVFDQQQEDGKENEVKTTVSDPAHKSTYPLRNALTGAHPDKLDDHPLVFTERDHLGANRIEPMRLLDAAIGIFQYLTGSDEHNARAS